MSIEMKIADLAEKAAPLRLLDDEAAEAAGLPAIVEQINALRAKQAHAALVGPAEEVVAVVEGGDAELVKRGPGRPKKAD